MRRPLFMIAAASLFSGCVTLVVHVPTQKTPAHVAGRTEHIALLRDVERRAHEASRENLEALESSALRMAAEVQAWMVKPYALGGSNGSFEGVTLTALGYGPNERHITFDGEIWMEPSHHEVQIHAQSHEYGHGITVVVTGTSPTDLSITVHAP